MSEIYQNGAGYGVKGEGFDQPFHPYKPGAIPLTLEEAEALQIYLANGGEYPFNPPAVGEPPASPKSSLEQRIADLEMALTELMLGGGI